MFDIHEFIMKTIKGMVGNYPDFQIREYALNWYAKGKLTEEDLAIIEEWLTPVELEEEEETVEEETDEVQEETPVEEGEENV